MLAIEIDKPMTSTFQGNREETPTSARPNPRRRTQNHHSPIPASSTRTSAQRFYHARPRRLRSARKRSSISRPQRWQIKRKCGAGEVGQGAGEVIETFGLQSDAGDCEAGLYGVGETDGRNESAEEGRAI